MAFSSAQQVSIRMYMGWSARFHQTDSALEFAMQAAGNDADVTTLVTGILASLSDIDTKLLAQDPLVHVEKAGSIDLDAAKGISLLRSKGRMFVARMATILGVEVRNDVYAGALPHLRAGYRGLFKPVLPGGGSNLPPLG